MKRPSRQWETDPFSYSESPDSVLSLINTSPSRLKNGDSLHVLALELLRLSM